MCSAIDYPVAERLMYPLTEYRKFAWGNRNRTAPQEIGCPFGSASVGAA